MPFHLVSKFTISGYKVNKIEVPHLQSKTHTDTKLKKIMHQLKLINFCQ